MPGEYQSILEMLFNSGRDKLREVFFPEGMSQEERGFTRTDNGLVYNEPIHEIKRKLALKELFEQNRPSGPRGVTSSPEEDYNIPPVEELRRRRGEMMVARR